MLVLWKLAAFMPRLFRSLDDSRRPWLSTLGRAASLQGHKDQGGMCELAAVTCVLKHGRFNLGPGASLHTPSLPL